MRAADFQDEDDLDLRSLRRTPARTTPVRKGWGRYLIGAVVSAVLLLFGAVVWFAYQDLMPGGDSAPPLIRAEAGPLKRQPDERGGLPVVNAESAVVQALDEPDAPVRVERIVPRQSTAPRSTADIVPEALEAEPAAGESLLAGSAAPAATGSDEMAEATPATAPADTLDALIAEVAGGPEELREIEPAAGAADGQVASDALPEALVLDPRPASASAGDDRTVTASVTPAEDVAPIVPVIRPLGRTPTQTNPAQSTPTPTPATTQEQAPAAPAPVQTGSLPAAPALAADFSGAFRVQLLAVRNEDAAAGAWANLQESYPGVLGALRSRVQRADLGDNTFFRLQAGPFADRAGAASVCSALQARGADCFVVEPTS